MTNPATASSCATDVAAWRSRVYRHLLGLTRDPALADDLTQETLLRAVTHLDGLRDDQAVLGWLYRIATNIALDHARGKQRTAIPVDMDRLGETRSTPPLWSAPVSAPQTTVERVEMNACIDRQLAALPDDYRVALLLHDGHGMTNPEIAQALGCSVATAKIRVHRGRTRLRAALAEACDFDTDDRGELACQPH